MTGKEMGDMGATNRFIRVVLAKPGLDGHDRGARVLAVGLRDAGMEVIYLGIRTPAETIVKVAIDEDADVIALSSLSGAHEFHFPRVAQLLHEAGRDDALLICGGVIPAADIAALKTAGFSAVFGPGTKVQEVVSFIRSHVPQ